MVVEGIKCWVYLVKDRHEVNSYTYVSTAIPTDFFETLPLPPTMAFNAFLIVSICVCLFYNSHLLLKRA